MLSKSLKAILGSACLFALAANQPVLADDHFAHLRYLASAEFNWQMKKREQALKDMDKCIEAYSKNAGAYAMRANMRGVMGDNKGALDDCNTALYLKPNLTEALRLRAAAKTALEDYTGAAEDFNALIKKDSLDARLFLARADVYSVSDKYDLAKKDIDKASTLDPPQDGLQRSLLIWNLQSKRFKDALPHAEKLVEKSPKSLDVYYFRAQAHSGMGQKQKAIEDYTRVIKIDPKFDTAYVNRGWEKMILKDYNGSIEDSETASRINPKHAYSVQNKALVYFIQGDFTKAAPIYKDAAILQKTPDRRVRSHLLSAFNFKLVGKTKEAQAETALAKAVMQKTKFSALVAYMDGSAKEEKVLAAASTKDDQLIAKTMMGIELLRLKKAKEARTYLSWVASNGRISEDETYIAKAFLDRKSLP